MRIGRKLKRAWQRDGAWGTLRLIGINLVLLPRHLFPNPQPRDEFDEAHGVETSRHIKLSELDIDSPHFAYGVEYSPVMPSRMRAAVEDLPAGPGGFTFVDLGSGKGRALMIASEWPFTRIIGVEFSWELHRAALENLRVYKGRRQCSEIASVCEDATTFEFPAEPLVIFLYNPFVGPTMLRVLDNIERSVRAQPREVYLIYVNPKMAAQLATRPCLEPLVSNALHCVYRVHPAGPNSP